jgi:hypothetical protein
MHRRSLHPNRIYPAINGLDPPASSLDVTPEAISAITQHDQLASPRGATHSFTLNGIDWQPALSTRIEIKGLFRGLANHAAGDCPFLLWTKSAERAIWAG